MNTADKNYIRHIWVSKKELDIITASLVVFYQEMCWLKKVKNNNLFVKKFEKSFAFPFIDLEHIERALVELRNNLENCNKEKICIFFPNNFPNKSLIIYTALNECSKNFEDYEVSIITGFMKEELDSVLNDFKELFPKLENQQKNLKK
jgi:hypothetical protein